MPSALSPLNWLHRAASITCVGEEPTLPAARLQLPQITKRFAVANLSPSDTVRQVFVDLGALRPINRIAMVRHRRNSVFEDLDGPVFAATDLVRHRLSNDPNLIVDPDSVTPDYDSGWIASNIVNGYGYHDHIVPLTAAQAKQTARYYVFSFNAVSRATAPDNYVWWGTGGLFDMWEFDIGFRAPFDYGWNDAATATRSPDGSTETVNDRSKRWREISMLFAGVRKLERPDLLDFLEKTGTGGRFYMVADASVADPRGCMFARNRTPRLTQMDRAFSRFELSLIESL